MVRRPVQRTTVAPSSADVCSLSVCTGIAESVDMRAVYLLSTRREGKEFFARLPRSIARVESSARSSEGASIAWQSQSD